MTATARVGRAPSPELVAEGTGAPTCAHCGDALPRSAQAAPGSPAFCCAGCEAAHAIIHEAGLGAYYLHRAQSGAEAGPARGTGRAYAEYDDPAFAARHLSSVPGGARMELFLEGIHCSACLWLVERLPRVLPGVKEARLDLGRAALTVTFDPERAKPSAVARALDRLGYPPHPSVIAQRSGDQKRDRALLVRLGVAGAIAGNVMLMALALYSGASADAEYRALFRWGSLVLSIPAVFYAGSVFLRGAWAAVRTRTPHMDLPVALGILAGFSRSAWNTVTASGEVYFDSITVLIFLLLVGRWLQQRHHRGATVTLELMAALAPATAQRVDGDALLEVVADALERGDLVQVAAGARLPADGIVVEGSSSIDASWLTGESLPVEVSPGARVYAGTENVGAPLRVRVETVGSETRLGRLMQSVETAAQRRAPIVRLADRIAGVFVSAVLGLGALTYVIWTFIDSTRALDNAVALLVVTCPCALGMATPLAVSAALKRAARSGLFFKGGEFLEKLAEPAVIAFDKTGTLTEGALSVAAFVGDAEVRPYLRAAEERASHPMGRALAAALAGEPALRADHVEEVPGGGVAARVAGRDVRIGSPAFVAGARPLPPAFAVTLARQAKLGRPGVVASVDGEVRAVVAFHDPLRADARASLRALRALGYELCVLSGDRPAVVATIAAELGELSEARGGMSPEDKLAWVERRRRSGPVVMVGDGVNDAAAMVAADVSLAVHGGAEASLAAADGFTTRPGVASVLGAVVGARRTLGVIRRGILFSLLYNLVGVGLSMLGWVSPLLAAVLMPLSSITVVTLALEARTFRTEASPS